MTNTRDSDGEPGLRVGNPYNLILLAGAISFSLAFWSPWPAIFGAAGELVYLVVLLFLKLGAAGRTRHGRQQQQVAEQRLLQWATRAEQEEPALEPAYLTRIADLGKHAGEIGRLADELGVPPEVLAQGDRLSGVMRAFTRMAVMHQRLARLVQEAPASPPIGDEIKRLEREMAAETDDLVRLSLAQAIALGQRRLRQHEQIDSRRRALSVKMNTLEMSLDYLRSHLLGGGEPAELVVEIDQVLRNAGSIISTGTDADLAADPEDGPRRTATLPRQTVIGLGEG